MPEKRDGPVIYAIYNTKLRSGKSLLLTYAMTQEYQAGKKLFANYRINYLPVTFLQAPDDMVRTFSAMREGRLTGYTSFFIDEMQKWLPCRKSSSYTNEIINTIVEDTGHFSCEFFFSTPHERFVDIQLRTLIDYILVPNMNGDLVTVSVFNCRDFGGKAHLIRQYQFDGRQVYPFYNSVGVNSLVGRGEVTRFPAKEKDEDE
jgi:hypothetical protein